jgi:hypothetical protein
MSGDEAGRDEAVEIAEIALLARRAGLKLSAADLAGMAEADRRTRAALRALRADLGPSEEPAITFDARM